MTERIISITVDQGGDRLDRFLASALPDLSRTHLQRLIEDGFVTVDTVAVSKTGMRLTGGERITVRVPPPAPTDLLAESIPLNVIYEDSDLIVIDKPAGMVVHPSAGHASGTLVNAVLGHDPDIEGVGDEARPGIVHRLDKDTSGLIVVAKNDQAHRYLQAQFKDRATRKIYLALVVGRPKTQVGRIEAPIGRDLKNRQRMAVVPASKGREAITEYRVRESFKNFTLVEAEPKTGRTHQIRVHFGFLGCPLAGDALYATRQSSGMKIEGLTRHFLHAHRLTLKLPSGEERTFESPLPDDLEKVLRELREIK
ncbi:MAG: RluA family pseudouridine synthase [Chloroflexi bacterium]|nr:RluA family pseudouridine synthase [Chloroflexota bacterium]MBI5348676.1 RluA family pseudouridine synthase [Chloroflexota bacterium]